MKRDMESGYDKWSEELRRKLEGYEEPVSGNVWDAISRDLENIRRGGVCGLWWCVSSLPPHVWL